MTHPDTTRLQQAVWRLEDILKDDDGQAWKEASKFLERLKKEQREEAKPAAPAVWPEPAAAQSRFIASPLDFWSLCSVEHARAFAGGAYEVRYLYTEQQVRELLARDIGAAPQPQAERGNK